MAIDQSKVGNVAARLMDTLENKYADDAEIKGVFLIVAVEHGGTRDTVEYATSEGMAYYEGIGMLELIKNSLLSG